jgi:hypothetical protein
MMTHSWRDLAHGSVNILGDLSVSLMVLHLELRLRTRCSGVEIGKNGGVHGLGVEAFGYIEFYAFFVASNVCA